MSPIGHFCLIILVLNIIQSIALCYLYLHRYRVNSGLINTLCLLTEGKKRKQCQGKTQVGHQGSDDPLLPSQGALAPKGIPPLGTIQAMGNQDEWVYLPCKRNGVLPWIIPPHLGPIRVYHNMISFSPWSLLSFESDRSRCLWKSTKLQPRASAKYWSSMSA